MTLFKEYFRRIEGEHLWSKDSLACRIALLRIYMPQIRFEFTEFVRMWNAHPIRKQRLRPHVVPGKPWCLYMIPNPETTQDCRVEFDNMRWRELLSIVERDGISLDDYLPASTLEICDRIIDSFGGLSEQISENTRDSPHLIEYIRLRDELQRYIDAQHQPVLSLLPSPTGSFDHIRSLLNERIPLDEISAVESEGEPELEVDINES